MNPQIKSFFELSLNDCEINRSYNNMNLLNHGDPLETNLMKNNKDVLLIDFENCFICPKEYDIQRHIYDYVIRHDNIEDILNYFHNFKNTYKNYNSAIDYSLLYNVLKIDLCKTVSWLYVVTNDKSRVDLKRQKNDLELYLNAIYDKRIHKLLNIIQKEVHLV